VSGRNDNGLCVHASQVRCTRLRRGLGSGATGGRVGGCGWRRWRRRWRGRRGGRRPDDCGILATTSRARHPRRRGRRPRHCGRGAGRAGGSANDRRDIEVSGRNDNGHSVHASQVRCTRLRLHVCDWPKHLFSIYLRCRVYLVAPVRLTDFSAR
jgi:hypothetical protein